MTKDDTARGVRRFRVAFSYQSVVVPCGVSTVGSVNIEFTQSSVADPLLPPSFALSTRGVGWRRSQWASVSGLPPASSSSSSSACSPSTLSGGPPPVDLSSDTDRPFLSQHSPQIAALRDQVVAALPSSHYLALSTGDTMVVEIDSGNLAQVAISRQRTAGWGTWDIGSGQWSGLRHKQSHVVDGWVDDTLSATQFFSNKKVRVPIVRIAIGPSFAFAIRCAVNRTAQYDESLFAFITILCQKLLLLVPVFSDSKITSTARTRRSALGAKIIF